MAEDEPYLLAWLRHQVDGPYWRQGSVADIADRITCPAFLIGGWRDGYPEPAAAPVRAAGRSRRSCSIGPWDHRYPDVAIPGPRIDHLREVVRWLDHWCRGIDTGVMDEPPIVVYMQEAGSRRARTGLETPGRWRAERRGRRRARRCGRASRLRVRAALVDDASGARPSTGADRLDVRSDGRRRPADCGRAASRSGCPATSARTRRARSSTRRAPLEAPLSILGRARAILHVASTRAGPRASRSASPTSDPDGASHLVAKGMLNGTRRRSLTDPEPLEPGRGRAS